MDTMLKARVLLETMLETVLVTKLEIIMNTMLEAMVLLETLLETVPGDQIGGHHEHHVGSQGSA
jgi:hypothetical protein